MREPKFELGQVVVTAGVAAEMKENPTFSFWAGECLARHLCGDWGDMCDDDKTLNESALISGGRLFSAYEKTGFPKIWLITEADRFVTTALFPKEY